MTSFLALAATALACHTVAGDRILGSDLAAALPAFHALAPDLVVGYAPRPGVRRLLDVAELERIAHANHLEVEGVVALCFERPSAVPDPDAVVAAMRKSLDAPEARIEVVELSKYRAPPGEAVFPRAWLTEPMAGDACAWNGYIQYDGGRFAIWARVRLSVRQRRVIAAVDLTPGLPVKAGDVRVEEVFDFPRRVPPLSSPEAAVGHLPRHVIQAGQALTAAALEEPTDVSSGETVVVEVRSGGAVLKLEAKAESTGRRGDMISVRNSSSGKLFRARIEDKGRVLVEFRPAPGASE